MAAQTIKHCRFQLGVFVSGEICVFCANSKPSWGLLWPWIAIQKFWKLKVLPLKNLLLVKYSAMYLNRTVKNSAGIVRSLGSHYLSHWRWHHSRRECPYPLKSLWDHLQIFSLWLHNTVICSLVKALTNWVTHNPCRGPSKSTRCVCMCAVLYGGDLP